MCVFGPVITTMATPFDQYNQVNMESLRKLILHLIRHESSAIVVTAAAGEAPVLSVTERLRIWETAVDFAGPVVSVIASVGTNSTRRTLNNIKLAEEVGMDGLVIVTPYYNLPTQKGLIAHFKQAAQSTDLPILIHNAPQRTGIGLELETIAELMEEKNIIGLVDCAPNLELLNHVKVIAPPRFSIYTGDERLYLENLKSGGCGVVGTASHVTGIQMAQIFELFKKGRLSEAQALDKRLHPVYDEISRNPEPASIKAILNSMGMEAGSLRLPLMALDPFEEKELFEKIKHLIDE